MAEAWQKSTLRLRAHNVPCARASNDAARESALFATALVDAYGLSADQIGILIERSADLAQIYGMDLPDAVLRKVYYQNAVRITPGLPQTGWPR